MTRPERQEDRELGRKERRADLIACGVLSLSWLAISAFIGIHGEFPINDDWAYSQAVLNWLETGYLERSTWTVVPLIPHAIVGLVFSWVLGFSFETLRLSGVLMGWAGVLGTYALCRQVGVRPLVALLGAAVVALNPLHVNLSFTFMTDVPFATMTTWSLVFLCRGLLARSWGWIALGVIMAEAAVLSRQPALAIPIICVIVLVAIGGVGVRYLLAAAAVTAVTAVTYLVLPDLFYGPSDSGAIFGFTYIQDRLQSSFVWSLVRNGLACCYLLGAFLAPATLGLVALSRGKLRRLAGVSFVLTGLALFAVHYLSLQVPLGLNVIYDFGLGVPTLHGSEQLPQVAPLVWWVLTALALGSGFLATVALLNAAWLGRNQIRQRPDYLLLGLVPLVYLPPLFLRGSCFDRYFLPALPPLVALLLAIPRPSPRLVLTGRVMGLTALAALGVFALAGTRDYLEHHRCRWALLDELTERGIDTVDIHGGFEFNFWHHYDVQKGVTPSWMKHTRQRFVVSLAGHLEGYRAISSRSYRRLLPPGRQVLTVLERESAGR